MKNLDYLKRCGVAAYLKGPESIALIGLASLSMPEKAAIIQWARNHKKEIISELTTSKTSKTPLEIAPMTFCLDGRPCRELQSLGGYDSPRCMMCGQSPFELQACPEGRWMFYADAQNIRSCLK